MTATQVQLKRCSRCKKHKPVSDFHKCRPNKDGLNYRCKPCQNAANAASSAKKDPDELRRMQAARMKDWRAQNPERSRANARAQRAKNRETAVAKCREWRLANPEKQREASARWKRENPERNAEVAAAWRAANQERVSAQARARAKQWVVDNPDRNRELRARMAARRRAAERRATPPWFDQWIVTEVYALAALRTELTGVEHHVAHIVPLRSKLVCGLHCHQNMQVLPWHDNLKKRNLYWPDMPDRRGR